MARAHTAVRCGAFPRRPGEWCAGGVPSHLNRRPTERQPRSLGRGAGRAGGLDHRRSSARLRLWRRLAAGEARRRRRQGFDDRRAARHHDPAPPCRASRPHSRQAHPALRGALRHTHGRAVAHGGGVRDLACRSCRASTTIISPRYVEEFLATGRGVQGRVGEAASTMVEAAAITAFAVDWLERRCG